MQFRSSQVPLIYLEPFLSVTHEPEGSEYTGILPMIIGKGMLTSCTKYAKEHPSNTEAWKIRSSTVQGLRVSPPSIMTSAINFVSLQK